MSAARAPLRVALVGAGDIGRSAHLPALLADADVELALVVDPDPLARERAAAQLGGDGPPVVETVDALERDETVPAWVVATPPWVTPGLVRRGLHAGRFVLAEKPIATSLDAARAGYEGIDEGAVARLQVGFSYRHDPAIERLQQLIADGALGGPLHVRLAVYDEVDDPRDREHGARVRETLAHGLPMLHDGAHLADWLRVLLGPAELAVAHAWSLRTQTTLPADNLCGATLVHPDGHLVQLEVGWLLPAPVRSVITVRGSRGCAEADVMRLDLRVDDGTVVTELRARDDRTVRCFARQLTRFVAVARGDVGRHAGAAHAPTLADGLASLGLTERIASRMENVR